MSRAASAVHRLLAPVRSVNRVRHPACQASLHLRSPILPVALLAFLIWEMARPGPFATGGIAFTASLLLIGYVWARTLATHVTTRRVLHFTALQVGDHLEETLVLENRSVCPVVYAEFVDQSTLPGYTIDGVRVGGARSTRQWLFQVVCRQRGVFTLGCWDVLLGDPFGIFEAHQQYREPEAITVYPLMADLPPGATRHRSLGDRSVLRQALRADTVSAMATRPYGAGDPLRHIHWRTTARRDEFFVRVFEPEALSPTWLILDLDEAVHAGVGAESSFEKMIMVAATLASSLLDQSLPVGMILDGKPSRIVPQQYSRDGLWTILHALALIEPGRLPLASALDRAASVVTMRDSLAILTPSLDPDWTRRLPTMTGRAAARQEVWLFDPASFGGTGTAEGLAQWMRRQGTPTLVLRRSDIRAAAGSVPRVRRTDPWPSGTQAAWSVATPLSPRLPAG